MCPLEYLGAGGDWAIRGLIEANSKSICMCGRECISMIYRWHRAGSRCSLRTEAYRGLITMAASTMASKSSFHGMWSAK